MNIYCADYIQDLCRNEIEQLSNKDYLSKKKLSWVTADNGIVVPPMNISRLNTKSRNPERTLCGAGGVLDHTGKYIEMSSQPAYGAYTRVSGTYSIKENEILYSSETVMYMNFYIHHWGHYLIDVINRLWFAVEIDSSIKIVYTCYRGKTDRIQGNYLELLKLMGIDDNRLVLVNEPTRFQRVIIPERSIYPGKYYSAEYEMLFDKIAKKVPLSEEIPKKIYCSRSRLGTNKEKGEFLIETILNKNGYQSVYMEALPLIKQIQIMNSAERIVMLSGSLAHNLLFARSKQFAYIINKTYRLNLHQFLINQISKDSVLMIDAYCSPLKILYGYGPFIIKTTPEFLRFCDDHDIAYDMCDTQNYTSFMEMLMYYAKWIWIYKKHLLMRIPICETEVSELEKTNQEVHQYYLNRFVNRK